MYICICIYTYHGRVDTAEEEAADLKPRTAVDTALISVLDGGGMGGLPPPLTRFLRPLTFLFQFLWKSKHFSTTHATCMYVCMYRYIYICVYVYMYMRDIALTVYWWHA